MHALTKHQDWATTTRIIEESEELIAVSALCGSRTIGWLNIAASQESVRFAIGIGIGIGILFSEQGMDGLGCHVGLLPPKIN